MRLWLAIPLALAACAPDETISGYSERDTVWQLESISAQPFGADATVQFPEEGVVRGRGPCNSYNAQQTAPYPWIEITSLAATRAACPDLPAETAFFEALQSATLAEASPSVLLLTGEDGLEMVFRALP